MFWRFSLTAAIRVFGAVAQLVLTLGVTRLAGAAEAGLFFFGYSILLILSAVARLGSELSGLRTVAALRTNGSVHDLRVAVTARVLLTTGCSIALALGYAVLCGPAAEAQFRSDHSGQVVMLLAAALPAVAVLGLMSELLKGAEMASLGIALQNIAVPGLAALGILFATLFARPDALTAAAAIFTTAWVSATLSLIVWRRAFASWARERTAEPRVAQSVSAEFKRVVRDAPSLLIVSTTSIVMQWIGAVILGFLAQPEDVAGYSVAIRIAIAVSIVHSAASSVIAPRMAAAEAAGDTPTLKRLSHQTSLLIVGTTTPILLALFVLAPFWLSFFGTGFERFGGVLRILVVGQIVAAMIGHSGTVLVMCGQFRSARWTSIIAAAALAMLMFALIPVYGAVGAAAAMSGGVIAGHMAGLLLVRRNVGFWSLPLSQADFGAVRGKSATER